MIQFFALIPRAPGISVQEFHDHWRHPHGTMGIPIANMRSYVQGHQINSDLLRDGQAEFEGIALTQFDNLDEATAFGTEPQYVDHVQPDEPNFVDQDRLLWLNTTEEVLPSRAKIQNGANYADALWNELDRPTSIVLLQFIRPDGNPDWAGPDDIELGRRIGALRHVRNYPDPAAHGQNPPFLGVRQLWWPTVTAFRNGVRGDRNAFDTLTTTARSALTTLVQAERFLR